MQTADNDNAESAIDTTVMTKTLSPAAQRALQEAEQRRRETVRENAPKELGGRGGADPARFGDWEINGRAIDF